MSAVHGVLVVPAPHHLKGIGAQSVLSVAVVLTLGSSAQVVAVDDQGRPIDLEAALVP